MLDGSAESELQLFPPPQHSVTCVALDLFCFLFFSVFDDFGSAPVFVLFAIVFLSRKQSFGFDSFFLIGHFYFVFCK